MSPIVIILLIELLLGLGLVALFWRNRQRYLAHQNDVLARRTVDATPAAAEAPAVIHPTHNALRELGFTELGQVAEKPPSAPLDFAKLPLSWLWVDAQRTTLAEVVPLGLAGKVVIFTSRYANAACVETSHPRGEDLALKDYHAQTSDISLAEAYQAHQHQQAVFSQQHGPAQAFNSLSDFLSWDVVYRKHHLPRKMAALTQRQLRRESLVVVGILFFSTLPVIAIWLIS